ncbi:helix-turn-helix transcriptional regulator [Zhouia spongiae]|uniref:Helix-turn-helix transcriptional regulator n=1 Tax=Zhouia spongiae TaxID=2202721 RepID=A0ABY3YJD9_9FLAO|nr:helix-turn-helix transcriptional regulator [Zhouia spongiae]UNY97751.1 helix-turn-helix transcriptional regulator [Zhouia spongiae]
MDKNLNKAVTKTSLRWKKRAKEDRTNRRNISRAQDFALELLEYMESNKIKQVDLANKMGVSAQQVNKILRAKANLTFDTLDKIADALEVSITSPKIKPISNIHKSVLHYSMQVVHKRKQKVIEEIVTSKRITKRNPVLNTNMKNMDSYRYTANQI